MENNGDSRVVAGDVKLSELFGSHDQLIVVHFMFGPDWENPCSSCSLWADGYSSMLPHINRKAAFVVTAGAPVEKLQAALKRKNWTFPFLSAGKSTFRADFGVNFSAEDVAARKPLYNYGRPFPSTEGPGYSVFYKDADGAVYHTFSTFARGMEPVRTHRAAVLVSVTACAVLMVRVGCVPCACCVCVSVPVSVCFSCVLFLCGNVQQACAVWGFFDMLPRGRNETRPMDWLKHKEDY